MNQIYCEYCGAELENGQEVTEFEERLFCDFECLLHYVDNRITFVEITDEYRL